MTVKNPPLRWLLLGASLGCLALSTWTTAVTPHRAAFDEVAGEVAFALSWIVVGGIAIGVGRFHLANRILTLALVLSANVAGSFGLIGDTFPARLAETATVILVPLQAPVAGHLLLAYPSGDLSGTAARRLVQAGYSVGLVEAVLWALNRHHSDCAQCVRSLSYVGLPSPVAASWSAVIALAGLGLALAFGWQLVRQYRAAGSRQQHLLRLPYAAMGASIALYAALAAIGGLAGQSTWTAQPLVRWAQLSALFGVPLGLMVGLVRERLAYRRIGDFIVASAASPELDLEATMGSAVGDPGLRIAFPLGAGFVDSRGRPVAEPTSGPTTEVTVVGAPEWPLAIVTHDRSLADEPALLTAAGSTARLLLENVRLQAEVRAQLLEVQRSRSRIVQAANDARVQLERDLHDGAQQRILAIGVALDRLSGQPADTEALNAAKEQVSGAVAELRALAAGIHPAVLTDLGLVPALRGLAQRVGGSVVVKAPSGAVARPSAPIEAAAYFAAAEAVTNALKHADATRVLVVVTQNDNRLVTIVEDDGVGGANPGGHGLMGIRDRLASAGGELLLESEPGRGTRVTMELPVKPEGWAS